MGLRRRYRVLVVDDDDRAAAKLQTVLAPHFACDVASSGEAAMNLLSQESIDVMVAHLEHAAGTSGFDLLASSREQSPATKVIVVGTDASATGLLEAGRRGAADYLLSPVDGALLFSSVARALSHLDEAREPGTPLLTPRPFTPGTIVGTSPALVEALEAADRVAHSSAPVLLIGETGTGKDLLAARIHARGPRRHRPYIVVNAGAIPSTLLDSELFGHVAGAFTGATRARRGLIAEAEGGTLFLDEIADLPIELQGRMLRVLEGKGIRPVGGDHERPVDVRFIAATHRDLAFAVRAGKFREDLYFRLNVLAIELPPLRDRRDDLPSLIQYFFDDARARNPRSKVDTFAPEARAMLTSHPWYGNVRELQAMIERLVVLGKSSRVEAADVAAIQASGSGETEIIPPSSSLAAEELTSIREITMRHVARVLAHTGGDKAAAAAILEVDISTLYRWLHRAPKAPKRRKPDG
jgi:two-component system response regulator HydG